MKTDSELLHEAHDLLQKGYAADAKTLLEGWIRERDIPQATRDEAKDSNFAGKGRSFPILTPADVAAAASSIGRAGPDNYSTDELKANIIRIAKRKGPEFEAQLPEAWKADKGKSKEAAVLTVKLDTKDVDEAIREAGKRVSAATKKELQSACDALMSAHKAITTLMGEEPDSVASAEDVSTLGIGEAGESIESLLVEPIEGALEQFREAGGATQPASVLLKLISPGWGTSGYYSQDLLKRDGPQVFKAGTFNMWNHATESETAERPEGDLDKAASVLTEDARWMDEGPKGPGLYAHAKLFSDYAIKVAEKGPHAGVSINAYGKAKEGEALGRRGKIIERLTRTPFTSVDYVTVGGRDGQVILKESANPHQPAASAVPAEVKEVGTMDATELQALQESLKNLTGKVGDMETQLGAMRTENAQLKEERETREAKDQALSFFRTVEGLPVILHEEMADALILRGIPKKEGKFAADLFAPFVESAARTKMKQLAAMGIGDGKVRGLGGTDGDEPLDEAKLQESLSRSFQSMGMGEQGAKVAALGRAS